MESGFKVTLKDAIRTIPDYPKPGVQFRDVTTLMGNAQAFRRAVDELVYPYAGNRIDKVAGIEARGFILGGAIAHQLSAGFVPIRKKGKLPRDTVRIAYSLEYGVDEMEMHRDAIEKGERVVLVDDLIATGGTAEAAAKLLLQMGAEIVAACFIIDLPDLGGRKSWRRLACRCAPLSRLKAIEDTKKLGQCSGLCCFRPLLSAAVSPWPHCRRTRLPRRAGYGLLWSWSASTSRGVTRADGWHGPRACR